MARVSALSNQEFYDSKNIATKDHENGKVIFMEATLLQKFVSRHNWLLLFKTNIRKPKKTMISCVFPRICSKTCFWIGFKWVCFNPQRNKSLLEVVLSVNSFTTMFEREIIRTVACTESPAYNWSNSNTDNSKKYRQYGAFHCCFMWWAQYNNLWIFELFSNTNYNIINIYIYIYIYIYIMGFWDMENTNIARKSPTTGSSSQFFKKLQICLWTVKLGIWEF